MGRKNKRKRNEYRDRLGFNPRKYVRYSADHDRKDDRPLSAPINIGMKIPKRGDIWFADLGVHPGTSVQDGCRPVLIISNDIGNRFSDTINVLPMTRHLKRQDLPCHTQIDPESIGDRRQPLETSMVLVEQVTTISKSVLKHYAGHVSDKAMEELIDQTLKRQFGLAGYEPDAGETGKDQTCENESAAMNTVIREEREHDHE